MNLERTLGFCMCFSVSEETQIKEILQGSVGANFEKGTLQ